jgi:hypothetical protein
MRAWLGAFDGALVARIVGEGQPLAPPKHPAGRPGEVVGPLLPIAEREQLYFARRVRDALTMMAGRWGL